MTNPSTASASSQPNAQPNNQSAILGGNSPAPVQAAVLGGLQPVLKRLTSGDIPTQLQAMKECLNYQSQGFTQVIEALQNPLPRIQYEAYQLLKERKEIAVKEALRDYKFWTHFDRLNGLPNRHALMFANRQVIDFESAPNLESPASTAYAIRTYRRSWNQQEEATSEALLANLIEHEQAEAVEALIFGLWGYDKPTKVLETLIEGKDQLPNLKAIFIGDIEDSEMMISSIRHCDYGELIAAYPKLEILKLRGSNGWNNKKGGLQFEQQRHENLMALTIESGGLSRESVYSICELDLPQLEYLELWFGDSEYGGSSSIEYIQELVSGEIFPKLKYLGLRNCNYTDDVIDLWVQSPRRDCLIELDISLGTLSDESATKLLGHSHLQNLTTLNITENYVSEEVVNLLQESNIELIADRQDRWEPDEDDPYDARRCSVAE